MKSFAKVLVVVDFKDNQNQTKDSNLIKVSNVGSQTKAGKIGLPANVGHCHFPGYRLLNN
jgi:hypothetical protein